MMNPTNQAISEFALLAGAMVSSGRSGGADGNLLVRGRRQRNRDDQPDHSRHQRVFDLPSGDEAEPWGITAGPDGNVVVDGTYPAHVGMIYIRPGRHRVRPPVCLVAGYLLEHYVGI